MNSNTKVTHELLMPEKLKMKLRVMMMMRMVVNFVIMVMIMIMMIVMIVMMVMMLKSMIIIAMMVVVMVLMINRVGGAAVNGDVSNIKHLIASKEITFTTTSKQNDCTVLYETAVLCTLDLITFIGISTQVTEIHVDGAILQNHDSLRAIYIY